MIGLSILVLAVLGVYVLDRTILSRPGVVPTKLRLARAAADDTHRQDLSDWMDARQELIFWCAENRCSELAVPFPFPRDFDYASQTPMLRAYLGNLKGRKALRERLENWKPFHPAAHPAYQGDDHGLS